MSGEDFAEQRPSLWTVGQLTQRIKSLLEGECGWVWVRGELSNVRAYASGHLYFTLRDANAQISGVMWGSRVRRLGFRPEEGQAVTVGGQVSVYAPRGQYQLVADTLRPEGSGALQAAYEALKFRLEGEGLFDPERKRPIPAWPRRVGVITSQDGAALRDVLRVSRERAPWVDFLVIPSLVQGGEAPRRLLAALAQAQTCDDLDYVVLARGGGSIEDLWAFNDEALARAIAASRLPVVSAVGHETDWTISDLVADLRVATPSHAATLLPDGRLLRDTVAGLRGRLRLAALARLREGRLALLDRARRVELAEPRARLQRGRDRLAQQRLRLHAALRRCLEQRRSGLARSAASLDALSPLAVLGRGYSLVQRERDGAIVRQPEQAPAGERLRLRLASGQLYARVEDPAEPAAP